MTNEELNSKCPNCGSQLKYHPKEKKLKCVSCASLFNIESLGSVDLEGEENDYHQTLEKLRQTKLTKEIVPLLNCENCGANLKYNDNTTSTICPFCGSNHIVEINLEEEIIPISGIIPFSVSRKECREIFHKWIRRQWLAPKKFKKATFEPNFYPVYLPFWTFDMDCFTTYSAQRGDYEYVTVTKRDSDGNRVEESERKLKWTYTSGRCRNAFDDVIVLGSKNQNNRHYIESVCNFDFKKMEKYNDKYMIGYYGEKISLPLEDGFERAKNSIKREIVNTIEDDVGGDEVRIISMNTRYNDITFKQVIAPIYNGIYFYKGKKYEFAINGQTCKCAGGSPTSKLMVFFIVTFIIIIVLLPVILFAL